MSTSTTSVSETRRFESRVPPTTPTEMAATESVNGDLQQEVNELQTDDGIRAAAREQLGYQQVNERRETIVGVPDLPTDLPDGWPYGPVEQIINLRAAAVPAGG